jgi:kynurenine formamidase
MSYKPFNALPRPDDTGQPLAWGTWGAEDQLGTLNHVTDAVTLAAAACIRRGARFNLDLPLHLPFELVSEGAFGQRGAPVHSLQEQNFRSVLIRDDKLDEFYLQGSSQWDGLTHIGTPQLGSYNGLTPEQLTLRDDTRGGIEHVAEHAVATRAVLVDLVRYFHAIDRPWDPKQSDAASAHEVQACLTHQGIEARAGDILLFRFGWLEALLTETEPQERNRWYSAETFAGIAGDQAMWEFFWDNRMAAAGADNPTLEVSPMLKQDNLHQAIPRLGFTIGELFNLEQLAHDSAKDGVYESFLTTSPLNLRGGVGSPPNAIAIK